MTMQKIILAGALTTISVLGLAACGGDSKGTQDVGSGNGAPAGASSRVLSARAIDGYLAGATVYVDQNENNTLDAFEARALTDRDGFFSYNHVTDTDYCAANAPATQAKYCLRAKIATDAEVLIRVDGGYDTITGLPFKGTLSLRSSELDRDDLRLVTPQTTMIASTVDSVEAKFQALQEAGLFDNSLDEDHIGGLSSASALRAQFATIAASMLGRAVEVGTNQIFDDVDADNLWASGIAAVTSKLIEVRGGAGQVDFDGTFSSPAVLADMLKKVAHEALSGGQPMPLDFTLPNGAAAQPLLAVTAQLAELNEALIAKLAGGAITSEQLAASMRIMAVGLERALRNPSDPELADLSAWVRNQLGQGIGLGSDLTALGGANVDLSALIDPQFNFDPPSNSISASATIPAQAATAFASLVNTGFGVNVNRGDEQGAALLFITGDSGASSGELDVCIRYRDNDGDFDTGNSNDPSGAMLVSGDWTLLNGHTLMLNIDVLGGVRSLVMKSVGVSGLDRQYRFDFGGDLAEWNGSAPTGFGVGSVPANDAQCRTALIERYGQVG